MFNTSSAIQDGPGMFVQEPFRYGPLRQDRPHVFKLFANYQPISALTLGGYLPIQSGAPWNARAYDWDGYGVNYLEQAGSHRNPAWTNFDLLGSYRFKLSTRASLVLEGRALNLFDTQTRTSTDSLQYLDVNTIAVAPWFAPYKVANPFYGTANGYAPPRRFVLAAVVNF